jgi:1,2-diacylglycerol 3-alpha-glucosyltransferase
MTQIAVIFDHFGPYHRARLQRLAGSVDAAGIQRTAASFEYAWTGDVSACGFQLRTVLSRDGENGVRTGARSRLWQLLDELRPTVLALPGWSSRLAMDGQAWAQRASVPVIAMSDSTREDAPRVEWKESVKRRLLKMASAALVAGSRHRDYLLDLGVPADCIHLGYDAVDNEYFTNEVKTRLAVEPSLRRKHLLPERFFLASCRFIEKKNLPRLLEAYALYRECAGRDAWDLVILGDGELRPSLEAARTRLGLEAVVQLPGFKQYDQLPTYYSLASAFIHASTVEQWGLVVNEAMASGLPVLVSDRCGCAPDLVADGVNGWTFDPFDVGAITDAMVRMSQLEDERRRTMGAASQRIIGDWGLDRFATGMKAAAEKAIEIGPRKGTMIDRAMLSALARVAS